MVILPDLSVVHPGRIGPGEFHQQLAVYLLLHGKY